MGLAPRSQASNEKSNRSKKGWPGRSTSVATYLSPVSNERLVAEHVPVDREIVNVEPKALDIEGA